jgi:hypothetical protein
MVLRNYFEALSQDGFADDPVKRARPKPIF